MKNKLDGLYGVLNIVQGSLVAGIPLFIPSLGFGLNAAMGAIALLMILAGPLLVFGGTFGRKFAAVVCIVYWLVGLCTIGLVLSSASYLYGIYGHYGRAGGVLACVLALLLAVVFWLIPGHELHYLKKIQSH